MRQDATDSDPPSIQRMMLLNPTESTFNKQFRIISMFSRAAIITSKLSKSGFDVLDCRLHNLRCFML